MNFPSAESIIVYAIVIFFGIGLHEYAHCKVADLAGDPTPGIYGRVTLNLTRHFEPLGTLMIFLTSISGYGIGWGRPAPMNPERMHNPRWDFFAAVAAGPISNFLQAVVYAMIVRFLVLSGSVTPYSFLYGASTESPLFFLLYLGMRINLALALFNLFPMGPLDGHWLLGLLMPEPMRAKWFIWNRNYGRGLLIVVIIGSQILSQNLGTAPIPFSYIASGVHTIMEFLLGFKF